MSKQLEIIRTEVSNDYTSTAVASTVVAADYRYDGQEAHVAAKEGGTLVLVVDGVQRDLLAGAAYEVADRYCVKEVRVNRVGGPKAAPWIGAKEEEKATYWFRQALLVEGGDVVADASVTEAIQGGSYDAKGARDVSIQAKGAHFNGILLDKGATFELSDSKLEAVGDGGDDLAGWGALIMADNKSVVDIVNCLIETEGAIRCGLYVDNTSIANVRDSVIYTKETPDTCEQFNALVPGMMKRVPFALGMEGTVRSLNVMADGQGRFKNCIVVSTGWGALSTDSGTAFDVCKTFALDVEDTLSGIGYLEVAQEGKEYTAKKTINGVTYGFTVSGSGYVTYADSGVHNRYRNCEFYAPDYIQVMGSGRTGSEYENCYLQSGHTAFMTQQTGGGVFELKDTKVDTVDALLQIKSGAANTGFSNIVLDNTKVNFNGKSTRSKDGILVELVESDDAGNPGITTYTINDHPEEAEATLSSVADSSATLKNGEYKGDVFNSIYNYRQALNLRLENASLTGLVSASRAIHVDLEGKLVPNGTVLNAFMGNKEYDHANYNAAQGGFDGDCKLIGRFCHTPAEMLNNPINVTLKDSKWTITGEGWINALTLDSLDQLSADGPVTLHVKALTVGGEQYADGSYVSGNVTVELDSTVIEVADNGVADAGQTYGNVKYSFIAKTLAGELNSKAVIVKRQNYIDGNLYFKLTPAAGFNLLSLTAEGGEVSDNTAGGELAAYMKVLAPLPGVGQMTVTVVVGD